MKIETKYDFGSELWASVRPFNRNILAMKVKVECVDFSANGRGQSILYHTSELLPSEGLTRQIFEESELFETEKEATEYSLTRNWERKNNEQ